jgi:hypothetical protein
MEKIHITTFINAPKERVWDLMLGDVTYREWTTVFSPGSYYKGDWEEGSKILFLGPNPVDGTEGGMVSHVKENRLYEFISLEHQGMVNNGVEDTTSDAIKDWKGAHENYTFTEKDGGTELTIDMDIVESEKDSVEKAWKDALVKLKEMAERE